MTPKKFMQEKNKLIFNTIGKTLIPKDQIENVTFSRLSEDGHGNALICPYCKVFPADCSGCPMYNAKNECSDDDSTYGIVWRTLREHNLSISFSEIPEMLSLIKQYNAEFGFTKKILRKLTMLTSKYNIDMHYINDTSDIHMFVSYQGTMMFDEISTSEKITKFIQKLSLNKLDSILELIQILEKDDACQ